MSDESESQSANESTSGDGEDQEMPERELASVRLTMGSGGPNNPLIMQPGAIVFERDPNSETTPRTNWLHDLSESDFHRYLDALDALSKIHVTNLFSTVRQSALDMRLDPAGGRSARLTGASGLGALASVFNPGRYASEVDAD